MGNVYTQTKVWLILECATTRWSTHTHKRRYCAHYHHTARHPKRLKLIKKLSVRVVGGDGQVFNEWVIITDANVSSRLSDVTNTMALLRQKRGFRISTLCLLLRLLLLLPHAFFHVNLGKLNTATAMYTAATWNPYIDLRQGVGLGRFDVLFNEMTTYRWRRRSAYSTASGQLLNHTTRK